MKKNLLIIGAIVLVGIIAVTAYVMRPSAEATAPIEAIPLATATTEVALDPTAVEEPVAAVDPTATPSETGEAYPAPETNSQTVENPAYPAPEEAATTGAVVFTIVQAESEARFTLDETLNGSPKTVIGTTDQVAGQISIDFSNPANSQLGVVQVNARTLTTDSNNRNKMIKNEILDTEPYEFITFTPTALTGLPTTIAVGDTVTFQITGDLTIRDITQSVTFDVTVTVVSETRLEGLASTIVTRTAYDLVIPSVPSVANVSEEVLVEIEFVAVP